MLAIYLVTILTISALYAPQPLLPVIVETFGVSNTSAASLTTISFIPLALAPLFYGPFLEKLGPLQVLRWGVLLLALSEIWFFFGEAFSTLMWLRLGQGLLIPALLTAAMTYLSVSAERENVSRVMATYIAATIVGGLLGRLFSGVLASLLGWRSSFLVLAVSLLIAFVMLWPLVAPRREASDQKVPLARLMPEVLKVGLFRRVYLMVFCFFFAFAAIMNFIPFRLYEVSGAADEWRVGLMYSGYLMGVVTALLAVRIKSVFGSEKRVVLVGLSIYACALLMMLSSRIPVVFVAMFLFCGAMFLVHATATGWLNRLSTRHKGVVNGLYVASYYGGGMLGSWLPGYAYQAWGWSSLVAILAVAIGVALTVGSTLVES